METVTFKIEGMCSCEGPMVEKRLNKLRGVESFTLNLIMNQLKVVYDPAELRTPSRGNRFSYL